MTKTSAAIAAPLLLALAACNTAESEDEARSDYRSVEVAACIEEAKGGLSIEDANAMCNCAIDLSMERYGLINDISDAQIDEILGQCVVDTGIALPG